MADVTYSKGGLFTSFCSASAAGDIVLIRYSPDRYQCFAYLLDQDGWQDMSQLNH